MTAQIPGLTGEQISALEMLAGYPNGCAESELKAKGFTIGLLGGLIRLDNWNAYCQQLPSFATSIEERDEC